ncbi:non-heme iron oxygenase ferredoxin subunit [Paraburkholderia fungorum]|uniref:non-heme iron oxygenase ferredoxin subunit n=1 Tax=Paraburkholderia fungorum TaxID=134537 RepID=UPI00209800C5|nr:non-heme iron oxygenase ferredoxin subunit [Paraburkholderia fungorum]USX06802.1 non-heme iron oxygenase ferredoxin subunit [Paraburkholderia fungorum]
MTEQWKQVATLDEIPEGETLRVEIGESALCLYRIEDGVFATDDLCTHGQASLADGLIVDGTLIECPLHEGAFDIRTGAPARPPCKLALTCRAVRVEGQAILVEL